MHFEKISYEQWSKDWGGDTPTVRKMYDGIKLPKHGTKQSMGADFFAPYHITILPKSYHIVPTGIRWVVDVDGEVPVGLIIAPRSGLGFKYGLRLANTVGVIDADFQFADNEGHIMIKLYNPSDKQIDINIGDGLAQGIIVPYYICDGADSDEQRVGGFGSTTNKGASNEI